MTNTEIEQKFKDTIDQYYAHPSQRYKEEGQLLFIGGVLQAALHILPWDMYYNLKVYCYEKHGYDPGGVTDGQMDITEFLGRRE